MSAIDLVFAYGRIPRDDRDRFLQGRATSAYRLIVRWVPGGLGEGFTDFVIIKDGLFDLWYARRFSTGQIVSNDCFKSRRECAEFLADTYGRDEIRELLAEREVPS